jgi:hypothetical protein
LALNGGTLKAIVEFVVDVAEKVRRLKVNPLQKPLTLLRAVDLLLPHRLRQLRDVFRSLLRACAIISAISTDFHLDRAQSPHRSPQLFPFALPGAEAKGMVDRTNCVNSLGCDC